jgi:hypothetical protein
MTESTLLSLIRQVRAQRRSQPDALEGERLRLEGSLIEFVEEAWPFIDAAPYQPNWAIDALCEHLQTVTEGRISRLLINFPPRCGKTIITSVCWIGRQRHDPVGRRRLVPSDDPDGIRLAAPLLDIEGSHAQAAAWPSHASEGACARRL